MGVSGAYGPRKFLFLVIELFIIMSTFGTTNISYNMRATGNIHKGFFSQIGVR